jgi:hypothetical protein
MGVKPEPTEYEASSSQVLCIPFVRNRSGLFGFSAYQMLTQTSNTNAAHFQCHWVVKNKGL